MNVTHLPRALKVLLIVTLVLSACSSKPLESSGALPSPDQIASSTPPFQTKEPQQYQAVRTISFTDPAGNVVTRTAQLAKFNNLRREESKSGDSAVVLLELDQGRFLLLPETKIFAEVTESDPGDVPDFENSPERLLHPGSLTTTYQKLGTDSVAGRSATKYRVVVNNSLAGNVTKSETLIWIDDSLGMPIKSDTLSSDGNHMLMELSKLTLEVNNDLFRIPEEYRKVSATDLHNRLVQKPNQ